MEFKRLELRPGEKLIMSGAANKMQLFGAKGGFLFLTNQRIVFKAHKFNFGSKYDEYELSDINNPVSIKSTSYLVSHNISISTKSGKILSFIVTNAQKDEWIHAITHEINSIQV